MAPEPVHCPHCEATLKPKGGPPAGKKVRCPKCGKPFVVGGRPKQSSSKKPPVTGKWAAKKKVRKTEDAAEQEARGPGVPVGAIVSAAVWVNAHLAVAACLVDSGIRLVWLVTHWNAVLREVGLGRLAVRQVGRELFLLGTAALVWFHGVLFRDRAARGMVVLFGGAYLLLFGVLGTVIALLSESVFERAVYELPWSVIYLGVSLLVYAAWGYGPETALERAERLTSQGQYGKALVAVREALESDPYDEEALELERTLKDVARWA